MHAKKCVININSNVKLKNSIIFFNFWLSIWSDVESVIRWHHEENPENRETVVDPEINSLIDVVMVGNWLAHSMNFGFSGHRSGKLLSNEVRERLSLDDEQLDFFKEETRESFKDFKNFLKLIERSVV